MTQVELTPQVEYHDLTVDRWQDLEALFGKHGAAGACWCR